MSYVYQVKHKETGEFYIGSKYAIGATPENTENYFGTPKGKSNRCVRYKYLLSNEKHLLEKTILGIFETKQDAISHEIKLQNSLFDNSLCLNGAKQTSSKFATSFAGNEHPMFGKIHSNESKEKMRLAKLGKPRGSHSPEHSQKISLAQKGRKLTEEHKQKLRLAKIGEKRESKIVICPNCNKIGGLSGMTRYHFDNCKNKESLCQL